MKLERQSTRYSIEIPVEDFKALESRESNSITKTLAEAIEELPGTANVEYNGHFGNYVFLTIEMDWDIPETHRSIKKMIRQHITQARRIDGQMRTRVENGKAHCLSCAYRGDLH